jgi:predicted RecB family nuclease
MDQLVRPDLTAPHPKGEWVSKSDLVAYLRCPYAFWLLDTRQIQFWETLGSLGPQLIAEGQAFHQEVLRAAMPLPAGTDFRSLLAKDVIVLGLSDVFRNPSLKILGRPDGVRTAEGALFPIEIKSHRDVSRTDELELAFYWLLLEPDRRLNGLEPRGYVITRRNPDHPIQEVRLRPERFDEVFVMLEAIREARRRGVKPRICGCPYCHHALRTGLLQASLDAKDLTWVWGIGRRYAGELERLGLRSYEDLLSADPEQVAQQLRLRGFPVSRRMVDGWRQHARSYGEAQPVIFGEDRLDFRDMLVLDLEYDSHIWLIGMCTIIGGHREYEFLWADSPAKERKNILALLDWFKKSAPVPIVTWSGLSADVAQLWKAIKRLRIRRSCDALDMRHLDLFGYLRSNVRLPIPWFGLKGVAEYFRIARQSPIVDGLEANMKYAAYRQAQGQEKKRLRQELLSYNRDDLDCLIEVVGRLQELA